MEEEYDDTYGDDGEELISWINWFCELKGNEFFCMVDREFIADDFNLTGLSSMVSFYHYALELILDMESSDSNHLTEEQKRLVESSAETLYGLIHARFITTSRGLKMMEEKFVNGDFGTCPRVFCGGQPVLPVGQSDIVRESSVKLFCPKCEDIFYPRSTRHKSLDGAFWGTTFPHLLLMQMREGGTVINKPIQHYVPRIYGFRICKPGTFVEGKDIAVRDVLPEENNMDRENDSKHKAKEKDKGNATPADKDSQQHSRPDDASDLGTKVIIEKNSVSKEKDGANADTNEKVSNSAKEKGG